jgi:hypothetical protein
MMKEQHGSVFVSGTSWICVGWDRPRRRGEPRRRRRGTGRRKGRRGNLRLRLRLW